MGAGDCNEVEHPLDNLLRYPGIWQGARGGVAPYGTVSTGFAALDQALPGRGWPLGALTEILHSRHGIGELGLTIPALARLGRTGRWLVWVAPPYLPYAPALARQDVCLSRMLLVDARSPADCLWSAEQALRAGSAVLLWPAEVDERGLRRLQLAAEAGRSWGLVFRSPEHARQSSPAVLRLLLEPSSRGPMVRILKCRGRSPSGPIVLSSMGEMAAEPGR